MKPYGHNVNQLARSYTKRLNERISPLGIFASQWGIILYLNENKQATQVELGAYLSVEAPTITRTLSRMEDMGWIVRREGRDKREKLIEMTDKAREMFPEWEAVSGALEKEATKGISEEEMEAFEQILDKILANLESDGK
jgi:MarR family transcriptional regulator, transcriptional regulator for hemolysin